MRGRKTATSSKPMPMAGTSSTTSMRWAFWSLRAAWLLTFDDFKDALQRNHSLLGELGEISRSSPLRDPARGDFRPATEAAGIGKGVKVFVPWALCGVVGEWNFYPAGNDPTNLVDEHWFMTDYHVSRDDYHKRPMYPLKGVNVTRDDYMPGPWRIGFQGP